MFKNEKKLTNVCKLNIKEIAFVDDMYYIKTQTEESYKCDETMLRKLKFSDATGICNKALKQLKNNQILDKDLNVTEIKVEDEKVENKVSTIVKHENKLYQKMLNTQPKHKPTLVQLEEYKTLTEEQIINCSKTRTFRGNWHYKPLDDETLANMTIDEL